MPLNLPITDWQGRRVWIIGASSGIGRAVAEALHARGARVIVSARQQVALHAFAQQHPGSLALALDVTDRQAVAARPVRCLPPGRWTLCATAPDTTSRCVLTRWTWTSCCATSRSI